MSYAFTPRRRVLLVEPAAVEANVFSAFSSLPLLGPLFLGTLLSRAGFQVKVISENLLGRRININDLDADFLLLTCLTSTVERGFELAEMFRRRNVAGKVAIGGPHVTFLPDEALAHADWVIAGEGENLVVDLLKHGSQERKLKGSPVQDLDSLPMVDWSLLVRGEKLALRPLMFSRGCPFDCNFCSVTAMFGRRYRTVSVERALEEIRRVDRKDVFIYDDNLTANVKYTHQILDGMLPAGKRFTWAAQVRADAARDPELLRKMEATGCGRAYIGFESIDDVALKEMKKKQTADDVRKAVRLFHKAGIPVHGMFIFGAETDDASTVALTERFVAEERIDSVQFMVSTPFPGTELAFKLESEGRVLHHLWRYYDGMHAVMRPRKLSPFEIQRLVIGAYRGFYNPLQAARNLVEAGAAPGLRRLGRVPESWGLPSPYTALFKLAGTQVIRRWNKINAEYMRYLETLPPAAAVPSPAAALPVASH